MSTQLQVNGTTPDAVQPPFVLTDLLQMASPQGVLLKPKSQQEVMQAMGEVVTERQCILNYHHLRVLQGGIEVDIFVMSSLTSSLFSGNNTPQPAPILGPTPRQSVSTEVKRDVIQDTVREIFRYKRFWKDDFMANCELQKLILVSQAREAFMQEHKLRPDTLSEHDKARVLRDILTKWLDEELCPEPGKAPPKKLSKAPQEIKDEWLQYLILRWQYIEGVSRHQVDKELKEIGCWITGGAYARYVKAVRKRLASLIWQKEMQAREVQ